jgi:hypothetical protein
MDNYPHNQPPTRFSWWDVLGVASYTTGTVLNVIDDGFRMLSRVFFAAGEESRERRDMREFEERQEADRQRLANALESGTLDFRPEDLT